MPNALIVGAASFNAVLYGVGLDRLIVETPAWKHVGVLAWAAYSGYADLGNGLVLYPLTAVGGTLLSVAAAIVYRRWPSRPWRTSLPIYAAAAFSIGGLLLTTQAAPFMLSLRTIADAPAALQPAFDGFEFWGGIHGVAQALAFVCNIWSLLVLRPPV
jgi:hypothetical protein